MAVPDLHELREGSRRRAAARPKGPELDVYADRLAEAGVRTVHRREPGLEHGFIQNMDLTCDRAAAAAQRLFADMATSIHEGPVNV